MVEDTEDTEEECCGDCSGCSCQGPTEEAEEVYDGPPLFRMEFRLTAPGRVLTEFLLYPSGEKPARRLAPDTDVSDIMRVVETVDEAMNLIMEDTKGNSQFMMISDRLLVQNDTTKIVRDHGLSPYAEVPPRWHPTLDVVLVPHNPLEKKPETIGEAIDIMQQDKRNSINSRTKM